MKELKVIKLDKEETRIVYVYENGVLVDKFEIKINKNDYLCSNRVK